MDLDWTQVGEISQRDVDKEAAVFFSGCGLHSCYQTKGLCVKDCQIKAKNAIESREVASSIHGAFDDNRKCSVLEIVFTGR